MRTKSVWRAGLLAALAALAPGAALAQIPGGLAGDYSPPDHQLPYPLYSNRPDVGGLFVTGGYVMYEQSNPIKDQPVAYRGFIASQPSVPNPETGGATFVTVPDPVTGNQAFQGQFIGSRALALDTNQVTGPQSFQPGFQVEGGWKFRDGSALTIGFLYIAEAQYTAAATLVNTPTQLFGNQQQDTFLTSPVYNFPSDFAGPLNKIQVPNPLGVPVLIPAPGSVFGIWNGASTQTLLFLQRFEQLQVTYRKPFYETETYRASYVVGPRYSWIQEKFRWTTTDLDAFGNSSPIYVGVYNNQVDNQMYGVHVGLQQEWYLGCGFAAMLTTEGAAFVDVVKMRVDYERGDRGGPENKRSRTQFRAVPEVQVTPSLMWYPLEGIQLNLGWDFFAFANTVASTQPIDFNYSALAPGYEDVFRWFTGFQASIALIF